MCVSRLRGQAIPTRCPAEIRQRALAGEIDVPEQTLCVQVAFLCIGLEPTPHLPSDGSTSSEGALDEQAARRHGALLASLLEKLRGPRGAPLDAGSLLIEPRQRDLGLRTTALDGAPVPGDRTCRVPGHPVALLVAAPEFRLRIGIAHPGLEGCPLEIPATREQQSGCGGP